MENLFKYADKRQGYEAIGKMPHELNISEEEIFERRRRARELEEQQRKEEQEHLKTY